MYTSVKSNDLAIYRVMKTIAQLPEQAYKDCLVDREINGEKFFEMLSHELPDVIAPIAYLASISRGDALAVGTKKPKFSADNRLARNVPIIPAVAKWKYGIPYKVWDAKYHELVGEEITNLQTEQLNIETLVQMWGDEIPETILEGWKPSRVYGFSKVDEPTFDKLSLPTKLMLTNKWIYGMPNTGFNIVNPLDWDSTKPLFAIQQSKVSIASKYIKTVNTIESVFQSEEYKYAKVY